METFCKEGLRRKCCCKRIEGLTGIFGLLNRFTIYVVNHSKHMIDWNLNSIKDSMRFLQEISFPISSSSRTSLFYFSRNQNWDNNTNTSKRSTGTFLSFYQTWTWSSTAEKSFWNWISWCYRQMGHFEEVIESSGGGVHWISDQNELLWILKERCRVRGFLPCYP